MATDLFRFEKRQLEKYELEACMKHTIKAFHVSGLDDDEQKRIRKHCLKVIECICKAVCIREVISKKQSERETLDQRKPIANKMYAANKFVKKEENSSRYSSPAKLKPLTSGEQGKLRHDRHIHKSYKKSFMILFEKYHYLTTLYEIDSSGCLYHKEDQVEGLLRDKRNLQVKLSTNEYCKVIINEMTAKWARRLLYLPINELANYYHELCSDFKYGYNALTGRWAMEMIVDNNLLTDDGIGRWAKHIKVIVSLSVYLTVLESVFHAVKRCGYTYIRDIVQG